MTGRSPFFWTARKPSEGLNRASASKFPRLFPPLGITTRAENSSGGFEAETFSDVGHVLDQSDKALWACIGDFRIGRCGEPQHNSNLASHNTCCAELNMKHDCSSANRLNGGPFSKSLLDPTESPLCQERAETHVL
jgi:hypothetical protein